MTIHLELQNMCRTIEITEELYFLTKRLERMYTVYIYFIYRTLFVYSSLIDWKILYKLEKL